MICVTGATGRLGSLIRQNIDPKNLDQFIFQSRNPPNHEPGNWIKWSIDADTFPTDLKRVKTFIHLAGATHTGSQKNGTAQFRKANLDLTLRLLEVTRTLDEPRILIASSASVYGIPTDDYQTFNESHAPAPVNEYGLSKYQMETSVLKWQTETGCRGIHLLRLGNIFGADQLIQNALNFAEAQELEIDQFESGSGPLRSYIGPHGLAAVLLGLARTDKNIPSILNVACRPAVRMETLIEALCEVKQVKWRFRPSPATAIERVVLDTTKLEFVLDMPRTQSEEELCRQFVTEFYANAMREMSRDDQETI